MTKPTLIIVGAGATGLFAAHKLSRHYKVSILEASERVGGRIHSILHNGTIIEAGAEFVHGNLPITLGLLKDGGIEPVKITGEMFRHEDGKFSEVAEMTEGWDGLLAKMEAVNEDITMQQLLDSYYDAPRYKSLRKQVTKFLAGFDLADVALASVQRTLKEWKAEEDDNYRVPGGYASLINYLHGQLVAEEVQIHTNMVVHTVRWKPGSASIITSGGKEFSSNKILITVPIPQLRPNESDLRFKPALPFDLAIANKIGFGAVIKLVLKFKKTFWQPDAGFILSDETFPTWWTQLPNKDSLLTGWVGGPAASALSDLQGEQLLTKGLSSLATIYKIEAEQLRQNLEWSRVFNWQKMSFINGGYSYATVDTPAAQNLLRIPIEDTIFFAGEALYEGPHPGTVEAAFSSALSAVNDLSDRV